MAAGDFAVLVDQKKELRRSLLPTGQCFRGIIVTAEDRPNLAFRGNGKSTVSCSSHVPIALEIERALRKSIKEFGHSAEHEARIWTTIREKRNALRRTRLGHLNRGNPKLVYVHFLALDAIGQHPSLDPTTTQIDASFYFFCQYGAGPLPEDHKLVGFAKRRWSNCQSNRASYIAVLAIRDALSIGIVNDPGFDRLQRLVRRSGRRHDQHGRHNH
jgi:hypothetical protein